MGFSSEESTKPTPRWAKIGIMGARYTLRKWDDLFSDCP